MTCFEVGRFHLYDVTWYDIHSALAESVVGWKVELQCHYLVHNNKAIEKNVTDRYKIIENTFFV